jgi:hypothetical protein
MREQRGRIVLGAVHHARLQRRVQLVEAHRDAVAPHGVHRLHEDGVAHHADLLALEVGGRLERFLGVHVARAGIHPAEADEPRVGRVGDLVDQLHANGTVDDLAHVRLVAKHEGQVEHVQLVHDRSHRSHAHAADLQRAHLRLLQHLLLAAELHGRVHLHGEAAVGRRLQLLAHPHDGFDGRIAEGVHVRGFEDHLLLRTRHAGCVESGRPRRQRHSAAKELAPGRHEPLLLG